MNDVLNVTAKNLTVRSHSR